MAAAKGTKLHAARAASAKRKASYALVVSNQAVIRKLLVGVAGLVLESLSIPKEQLVAQRQQNAALRRVHQCERVFFMVAQNGSTVDIEIARQNIRDARTAFESLFSEKNQ